MADNKGEKTSQSSNSKPSVDGDDSNKRKRRVLRPAAEPTTLREQSEKAQAKSGQERKRSRVGRVLSVPFRLIGRAFRPLGKFKLFRVIGYILAPPYIRNAWKELRLVTWPNAKQTRQLVFAVIVFSVVFGGIVAVVDYGLDKAFRAIILKK
jgi:preprotein translocase SecE subunit